MMAKGKPTQVVVTAIARELAGFVWSIACITSDPLAETSAATTTSDEVCPTSSTGRCHALPRQPLKATARRAARPEQTGTPIELRYVTVDTPCPEANKPTTRGLRLRGRDGWQHRLKGAPDSQIADHHPACTAGGGTCQGNPRRLAWNSTSACRERQARDAPWSCGNQPADHSMINRRLVPPPTAHARISEMQPGEKEPDGILRPDPLKTDMTASLVARSKGLPVVQCRVLDP
jgi:hypothetical protein